MTVVQKCVEGRFWYKTTANLRNSRSFVASNPPRIYYKSCQYYGKVTGFIYFIGCKCLLVSIFYIRCDVAI